MPSRFGVIGGDLAGFPNGRRLADDVVDISLQVVAGILVGNEVPLGDGVDVNDQPFPGSSPMSATPTRASTPTPPPGSSRATRRSRPEAEEHPEGARTRSRHPTPGWRLPAPPTDQRDQTRRLQMPSRPITIATPFIVFAALFALLGAVNSSDQGSPDVVAAKLSDPGRIPALTERANTALIAHDFPGGLALARQANRLEPDLAATYPPLIDGLIETGRYARRGGSDRAAPQPEAGAACLRTALIFRGAPRQPRRGAAGDASRGRARRSPAPRRAPSATHWSATSCSTAAATARRSAGTGPP